MKISCMLDNSHNRLRIEKITTVHKTCISLSFYLCLKFPRDIKKSQAPVGKKICVVERKYVMMKEKQNGD